MTKLVRLVIALVALLATTAGTSAARAGDPGGVSDVTGVGGTGTFAPGLPSAGCAYQTSVTFQTTVMVYGGDEGAGMTSLALHGASTICETLTSGAGSLTAGGGWSGSLSYTRTNTLMTFSGTLTNVEAHTQVAFTGQLAWTSVNPVTTFVMAGPAVWDS